jgi:hypothetical protein
MRSGEIRFRLTSEARKAAGRLRTAVVAPSWRRDDLPYALRHLGERGDWSTIHRAIASRIVSRRSAFPIDTSAMPALVRQIRRRFPRAARNAAARADRIVDGRYDLLGYRDVVAGSPPSWHADPVHHRHAPAAYWSSIAYLDPACGDHKIIWELNRHQHWLALGRAFHLTGDRRYYVEFVAQLASWLATNPPLVGINWCSMLELAFRCLSWTWALHLFAGAVENDAPGATPWTIDLLVALDRQLTHVEQNLSRYFSPNTHLTGEALALYVCSQALPELDKSACRAGAGRAVLLEEAQRQIRADGGHAELSPHYHRYSTDFYLLALAVARAAGDTAATPLEHAARRQAEYLRTIADDRGRLPLIGDDDGGQLFPICGPKPYDCSDTLATAAVLLEAPALAVGELPEPTLWVCAKSDALDDFAPGRARWKSRALPASGYYVSRTARGDHLVFDAGPHGFLNGGHAHADALSLTITTARRPLVVDPGTATYTIDPALRDWFRSSAMHNTVVVGGRSQSVPLGPFHWRSTVDARATVWHAGGKADYAEAAHDGYAPVIHTRSVLAVHGLGWIVIDHLLGSDEMANELDAGTDAEAFWHIHPDWRGQAPSPGVVTFAHVDGYRAAFSSSLPLELVEHGTLALFAPVYGDVMTAPCLRARFPRGGPVSAATVILAGDAAATPPSVDRIALAASPGDGWHAAAFHLQAGPHAGILLAAVERNGVAAGRDAGPGRLWGTASGMSDARVAFFLQHDGMSDAVLVNGARFETNGFEIALPAKDSLTRKTTPGLASHVHEPAAVHVGTH